AALSLNFPKLSIASDVEIFQVLDVSLPALVTVQEAEIQTVAAEAISLPVLQRGDVIISGEGLKSVELPAFEIGRFQMWQGSVEHIALPVFREGSVALHETAALVDLDLSQFEAG